MKKNTSTLLILFFFCSAFAQKAPMKWGKVPKTDLAMTTYKADPEADALVLGEVGEITFDLSSGDLIYKLDFHKRIKILKQSGFDQGDVSIPFYAFGDYEDIKNLKAQVILPDGKKISVKDTYKEKINDYWSAIKFAFPKLAEGCIIEYKYVKTSEGYYNLEEWYFQEDIPVRLSQLTTLIPEWYHYIYFSQGRKATIKESSEIAQITVPGASASERRVIGSSTTSMLRNTQNQVSAKLISTVYSMENVPALKVEPFITTMDDYYAKIQFQLQMIQYPNGKVYNIENTWDELEKELMEMQSFGDQINKKRNINDMWEAIEPRILTATNNKEKTALIYQFIASNINWDETYSFLASETLDDAFHQKSANSGELNLMFIALCKQAGIAAFPVLISTRSHGKMLPYYPKIDQFNHVIAYVELNDEEHFFDIGTSYRPPELIRENSLNATGWLVKPNNSKWISINSPIDKEICLASFELAPDGTLTGSINQTYNGYNALHERIALHNDSENKKLKEIWIEKFADIQIDSVHIENHKEINETFKTTIHCKIPSAAQVSGDFIYITPVLDEYSENPFKLEERQYAIDMNYGFKNQYVLNLTIPEGYVVDELPEPINLSLIDKGGKFQFFTSQNGNTIQLINKISISQLHFEPEEYLAIKNFYDIIVEKHSEQIVLKKRT